MLRFHGSRDKKTFELIGTNSRSTRSRPPSCVSRCRISPAGTPPAARARPATRTSASATWSSCPPTTRHVYHMYVVRSPERDRIAAALAEREIASAAYYTTPLHLQPALRHLGWERGSCPRPSVPRPRIWRCRSGAGSGRRYRSAWSRRSWTPSRSRRPGEDADHRHRLPQLAADLAIVVVAWFSPSGSVSTPRCPRTTSAISPGRSSSSSRRSSPDLRALRLLQPLVALRLDTRHVGRGAGRRRGLARHVPRLRLLRCSRRGRAADRLGDRLPAHARARRGSRMLARTIIERPQTRSIVARGKEVIVVGAGDAAQLMLKETLRTPASAIRRSA